MQPLDFGHHFRVDRKAAGGIDEQDVMVMAPRPVDRRQSDRLRLLAGGRREEIDPGLPGDRLQLIDGRRTIDVAGHHQHLFLVVFLEELAELADGGRLARALQAGHQHNRRRPGIEGNPLVRIAHDSGELAMNDANQGLARAQRADDLLANCLLPDRRDEVLDHRQGDIGLEQRHAHLAQGVVDVGFGQTRFALERLHDAGKAVGQVIEHGG